MDNSLNNDDPPTIEDSDNEAGAGVAGAPRSSYASLPDAMLHPTDRIVTVSHQARLRQQAHAPVGLASRMNPQGSNGRAGSVRPSHLPMLNNLSLAAAGSGGNDQQHRSSSFSIPEYAMMEGPTSGLGSSGWSVVETGGGTAPSARSLHAAAILNGIMYVFGGYDGMQRVNTFHAYSFAEKRWSPVLPASNISHCPSPRDRHVAFSFGNSFYVHGGFDGTSRVSDCWGFDFSSMTWREVQVLAGRPPSPRHSHAAVVYRQSVYIFGGYDGSYKSDLHEFDFNLSQWNAVPAAGRRPRARYRATAVVHKNMMILFGGHDGTRHLCDANVFDFDTRTWSALTTEGPSPTPRDSHVSVVHSNSMYIFGGSSGSAMNDLHELQLPPHPVAPAKW